MAAAVKNRAGNSDIVKRPYGFGALFRMKLNNPWRHKMGDGYGHGACRKQRRTERLSGHRAGVP
ncbi:Uncharacterised protein [Serratia rubidaea]|nr:conserved protein of unknown function [Serratia sp. Tan611]SQJ18266.1 Uncharacterised protein [Serratia rubidaea]